MRNLNSRFVVTVKSMMEILQNFVALSEYMNLNDLNLWNTLVKCWMWHKKPEGVSENPKSWMFPYLNEGQLTNLTSSIHRLTKAFKL